MVVEEHVPDIGPAGTARNGEGFNPARSEPRSVLFVEVRRRGAVRVALQRDRVLLNVWQQIWGNPHIVLDHLTLGEAGWVHGLLRMGDRNLAPLDVQTVCRSRRHLPSQ